MARHLLESISMISALVVTVPSSSLVRADLFARLASDPRIVIGELIDDRLPIVTETDNVRDSVRLVDELESLPGIRVDVVALDFVEDA